MAQSGAAASAAQMVTQLEAARKLALADSQVYKQILPGIMPIIGPTAPVEVRRWGAEFLAEGFASPALPNTQKEEIVAPILPTFRSMLEVPGEDAMVVKGMVQAATSLYPLVFRRVYVNIFVVSRLLLSGDGVLLPPTRCRT
jgi:symplekin